MVLTETGLAKVFQRIKSFIASQLNSKASAIHTHTKSEITDFPTNYVTTDTAQTVGGNKDFSGTTNIQSLTINGVACGDILTHNASEFVNVTSNQTIGGNKTFSGNVFFNPYRVKIKHSSQEIGVVPSANQWNGINFIDKNNSSTFSIEQGFLSNGNTIIHFSMTPNIVGGSPLRIFESTYYASTNETATRSRTLIPDANNSRDLGTSTNKWKSLNGINPGALSLPGDAYIDIDTTNYAWGSNFTFTPDYDGYCFFSVGSSSNSRAISLKTSRGEYYFSNQNNIFRFTFPVYKGKLVTIMTASSGTESIIPAIRVFSCQGNV